PSARAIDDGLTTIPQRFPERLRRRAQDHQTPQSVMTTELVVVNFRGTSTCGIGTQHALKAFRLVDKRDTGGYRLLRYRAAAPQRVAPRALVSCMSDREVAVLLHES